MIFVVITIIVALMAPFLHPRLGGMLSDQMYRKKVNSLIESRVDGSGVDPRKQWQFNDLALYTKRYPVNDVLPNGKWTEMFPGLSALTFDQVSVLESKKYFSLDLVPTEEILPTKWEQVLDISWINTHARSNQTMTSEGDYLIITIYDAKEARSANGYYFEEKIKDDKTWVNISYYDI